MVYSFAPTINYMARPARENRRVKPDHGRRLVARRGELGLSLADIERETDGMVYDQLLWRVENGIKDPDTLKMSQRAALAQVLEWTTLELDRALGFVVEATAVVEPSVPSEPLPSKPKDRLKVIRERSGLSRKTLSERSGISQAHISRLEDNDGAWQKSSKQVIDSLAKGLELDSDTFIESVNGTPYPARPNVYTDQATLINPNLRYGTRKIPKYSPVGMGPGGRGGEIIGYVDIPETWAGEYFAYDAVGDSMSPLIPDGTELIIREQSTADPEEVVLCYTPDDGTMLKVFAGVHGEGDIKLTSFNEAYSPIWTRDLTIYGILWETRTAWKANGRRRK